MSRCHVLITGFEAFDGHRINVSWELARSLPEHCRSAERWVTACLPCAFGEAAQQLESLIETHRPDHVFALGQAEGRSEITIERIAINVRDARIPDNRGFQPIDEPVIAGAPLAYLTGLPYRRLVRALRDRGHPVALSNTAGTFVCNEVFFALQHLAASLNFSGGFVHLPVLPEQVASNPAPQARVSREDAPIPVAGAVPALTLERQRSALVDMIRLTVDPLSGSGCRP
jgi:pyroglutamyl-peptidase